MLQLSASSSHSSKSVQPVPHVSPSPLSTKVTLVRVDAHTPVPVVSRVATARVAAFCVGASGILVAVVRYPTLNLVGACDAIVAGLPAAVANTGEASDGVVTPPMGAAVVRGQGAFVIIAAAHPAAAVPRLAHT
eukprot:402505-Rhodomonas_salina.1